MLSVVHEIKVSEKRLALLRTQLETEVNDAHAEYNDAEVKVEEAQKEADDKKGRWLELVDELRLLNGELLESTLPNTSDDLTNKEPSIAKINFPMSNGLQTQKLRFWEMPGFNWREFIPEYIKQEDQLLSTAEFVKLGEMTSEEAAKYDSSISSAIWHLSKPEIGVLIGFQFPGIRGAFYGLDSFFRSRSDENPKLGTLKDRYLVKLSNKLNRPVPILNWEATAEHKHVSIDQKETIDQ